MKKSIQTLLMAAAMLVLLFTFTSCEDLFGEWSRPVPVTLTNLSSALEEGALVTITYTVDGVTYTSTFKKVGDEYVEQSTTSAARALTRGEPNTETVMRYPYLKPIEQKALDFSVIQNAKVVLNAKINSNDGSYAQTFSDGAELNGVNVNGQKASLTNANDKAVNIYKGDKNLGSMGFLKGETVYDYLEKQSKNGHIIFQKDDAGGVIYSNGGVTGQLYNNAGCTDPVTSDGTINQDVYLKVEPLTYQEANWDAANKTVVYTEVSLNNYTLASSSSGDVTWAGGTYVVNSNVTIEGDLNLDGIVNLILCDGAKLTVKRENEINGYGSSLTIYSQSLGEAAGNLVIDNDGNKGLENLSNLTIHGGNFTVNSVYTGIYNTPITVYGGKLSIESSRDYAINTGSGKDMTVYGGEVNAISKSFIGINVGNGGGTLTVYDGKVTAQGGSGEKAIEGYFAAGEGTNIDFQESADGSTWTAITGNTTDKSYFKAEPSTAPATVAVTGVTLNETSLELTEGGTVTLEATIAPADATNKNVGWESSKTAVATVDQTGKVTAVAPGDAIITVTTKDGSKTATCTVKVLPQGTISDYTKKIELTW